MDGVTDVRELYEEKLRDMSSIVARIDTNYITGLTTIESEMLILGDIEKLMTSDEMELMDKPTE